MKRFEGGRYYHVSCNLEPRTRETCSQKLFKFRMTSQNWKKKFCLTCLDCVMTFFRKIVIKLRTKELRTRWLGDLHKKLQTLSSKAPFVFRCSRRYDYGEIRAACEGHKSLVMRTRLWTVFEMEIPETCLAEKLEFFRLETIFALQRCRWVSAWVLEPLETEDISYSLMTNWAPK